MTAAEAPERPDEDPVEPPDAAEPEVPDQPLGVPADADEATRQDLAERMAGPSRAVRAAHPAPADAAYGPLGRQRAGETIGRAVRELYNAAQIDVMVRLEKEIAKQDSAEQSGQV